MPVSYTIYEAVGSAAKIDQEPVYTVNLSRQRGYPVLSVNVIDDADWKPGKRKTNHYRPTVLVTLASSSIFALNEWRLFFAERFDLLTELCRIL